MIKGVGKRQRTEHLSAHIASSLLPYCRVAIVVGKLGHTVVERNRLRRQLRELVRLRLIPGCTHLNLILQALPSAYKADFKQLSDEVNEIKLQFVAVGGN